MGNAKRDTYPTLSFGTKNFPEETFFPNNEIFFPSRFNAIRAGDVLEIFICETSIDKKEFWIGHEFFSIPVRFDCVFRLFREIVLLFRNGHGVRMRTGDFALHYAHLLSFSRISEGVREINSRLVAANSRSFFGFSIIALFPPVCSFILAL